MTHSRREVLHAQWDILLDDEFMEAYIHGIVIQCCDRIMRRFYLRIFTYSADYQEKYETFLTSSSVLTNCRVLLATIRAKGSCPCPRCLLPLSLVQNLGTVRDRRHRVIHARVDDEDRRNKVDSARDYIYKQHYAVDSEKVEDLLKTESLVPIAVGIYTFVTHICGR
jgi:hypothetical protein